MIQLCLLVLAMLTLIFGALVFLNKPKDQVSKLYGFFSLGSASWMVANAFTVYDSFFYTSTLDVKLFANQLVVPTCTLAAISFLLFAAKFTGHLRHLKPWLLGLAVLSTVISLFTFTDAYSLIEAGEFQTGSFYWLFLLNIVFYMLLTAYVLFRRDRRQQTVLYRTQLFYLRTGYVLAAGPAFLLGGVVALFSASDMTALAPASLIFFILFAGIAIVRHKLFDIRIFVARSLAYALVVATLASLYVAGTFGLTALLIDEAKVTSAQNLLNMLIALFLAATFQPIKRFFDRLTNNLFYRDAYDAQGLLDRLSTALVSHPELEELVDTTTLILRDAVGLGGVGFVLKDPEKEKWRAVGDFSRKQNEQILDLVSELKSLEMPLIIDQAVVSRTQQKLHRLGLGAVFKMSTKTGLVGYLVLGSKKSGNPITGEDMRIFGIISDELAIAFQSATRFEEIENFNDTLQQEIEDATRQLRYTNAKLKSLDETKDEFISMASHQLRTPLTSVKGYVSMVLEGDAGNLNDQQKRLLSQAFTSAQHMNYLISDLLNVSRLRTGKFVIETKPTFLPDVIEGEISQLYEIARAKNIELSFDKPAEFPTLELDETKVRQVIMNFTDNAVHYTPPGGKVRVELEVKSRSVEFRVVDTGLGVPKRDQHKLFGKFFRAENARRARPDGTGLGLFMAKKVIVAQGGSIIFRSQEGKGSTFGFVFPLKPHKPVVTEVC